MLKIGFIGAGKIAQAMAKGFIKAGIIKILNYYFFFWKTFSKYIIYIAVSQFFLRIASDDTILFVKVYSAGLIGTEKCSENRFIGIFHVQNIVINIIISCYMKKKGNCFYAHDKSAIEIRNRFLCSFNKY